MRRAADDDMDKRKIAGAIIMSRDKCWNDFLSINDPLIPWALKVLAPYAKGRDDAPECLKKATPQS